jgi:hypothetical protein
LTLALATTALAQEIRSNAEDSFITKPNGSREVDFGATIHLDSKGYPMLESFETIYDEMDYQGAVSAYLQAMPQMNLFGSLKTAHYYGATGNTDSLVMHNDPSVDGMLTPNRVVTYLMNYANLAESGPMVFEQPAGATAGLIMDMQMRWHADTGLTSPYQGKRVVKYLVLTVDQELPAGINKNGSSEESVGNMRLEKHWSIIQNTVNDNKSNSIKEMPSAHRDITKSSILDQVICIRWSEHSENRTSRCDRGGYKGSTEWFTGLF